MRGPPQYCFHRKRPVSVQAHCDRCSARHSQDLEPHMSSPNPFLFYAFDCCFMPVTPSPTPLLPFLQAVNTHLHALHFFLPQ
eukprot:5429105-Pleurochrysis_carterae.AAC.1